MNQFWKKLFGNKGDSKTSSLNSDKLQSEIIIESIGDGVIVINKQGNISLMNPAAARLTEWNVNDAIAIDYRSVVQLTQEDGKTLDANNELFNEALQSKQSANKNLLLIGRNKKQTIVSVVVSPILTSPDNQIIGAVAVFHDITEQRKAEQQRADFISTASHEMRTPVAAIEGYLSLAMNSQVSNIDTKAREFLEKAHQSTKQLGKLFQDLLTSSRAEDGRLVNHPKVVEMSQFLKTLAESFQIAGQKKHLIVDFALINENEASPQISGKVITPLYYVHVDPDRISEVISNIFDNALKYTQAGKITVGIGGDTNNVQVFIQDTGAGIPADDIPHLFQKFYRVDNSSVRTIGGTGLGLFICKKIVELYGGRIWVESELGKGSVFRINLPRLSTQQAESLMRTESIQDQIAMPPSNATL